MVVVVVVVVVVALASLLSLSLALLRNLRGQGGHVGAHRDAEADHGPQSNNVI